MSLVPCNGCGAEYSPIMQEPECPHTAIPIGCTVERGDGAKRRCKTVDELHEFIRGALRPENRRVANAR